MMEIYILNTTTFMYSGDYSHLLCIVAIISSSLHTVNAVPHIPKSVCLQMSSRPHAFSGLNKKWVKFKQKKEYE